MSRRSIAHVVNDKGEHAGCPDPAVCDCECKPCKRAWFAAGRPVLSSAVDHKQGPVEHFDDVSSCTHCPFSIVEDAGGGHVAVSCGHSLVAPTTSSGRIVDAAHKPPEGRSHLEPPDWCPLRTAPTVVRLVRPESLEVQRELLDKAPETA